MTAEHDIDHYLRDGTAAAPPMANGELVFDEPWQGRLFGIAHALRAAGAFQWDEFREHLIAQIARWEQAQPRDGTETFRYYDLFQRALEALLAERGLCTRGVLDARVHELTP